MLGLLLCLSLACSRRAPLCWTRIPGTRTFPAEPVIRTIDKALDFAAVV